MRDTGVMRGFVIQDVNTMNNKNILCFKIQMIILFSMFYNIICCIIE